MSDQLMPGDAISAVPLKDTSELSRFDLVLFRTSSDSPPSLKRIWGLPGESIAIRDGEFYVDNQLLKKNERQFRDLAIDVATYPSTAHGLQVGAAGRAADSVSTPWISTPWISGSIEIPPSESLEWYPTQPGRLDDGQLATGVHPSNQQHWLTRLGSIQDDYPDNQNATYQLQPVSDLQVEIRLAKELTSTVILKINSRLGILQIDLHGAALTGSQSGENTLLSVRRKASVMLLDERLVLSSDTETQELQLAEAVARPSPKEASPLLSITAVEKTILLERLTVRRDIYLRTNSREGSGTEDFGVVPADHYFVLGDNQPVSTDSRDSGPIPASALLGRVRIE